MSDPDYSGLYKHICSNNVMTVPMKTNYFKHVFLFWFTTSSQMSCFLKLVLCILNQ